MNDARELLLRGTERLRAAGIGSARLDARVLLAHVVGSETPTPGLDYVKAEDADRFDILISRRALREPLAYITGSKEFWSLDFEVGPGVLVPRPETETLIEEAMRSFPDRSAPMEVLDLGTGTGCLLVAFLANYPRVRGVGMDVSSAALAWAHRNAARHRVGTRCEMRLGDWNRPFAGSFDVIFANPPYLSATQYETAEPEIEAYEPRTAFVAEDDGLSAYRTLAPAIFRHLRPQGLAFVEIGATQRVDVTAIFEEGNLRIHRSIEDLAGMPRCLVVGHRSGTDLKKQLEIG